MPSPSQEDHALAHQRESLKKRHLPGSDDSVGEDPLALVTDTDSQGAKDEEISGVLCHRQPLCKKAEDEKEKEKEEEGGEAVNRHQAAAGPVRLELGMDAEVLDKILHEIEVSFTHAVFSFCWALPAIFYPYLAPSPCSTHWDRQLYLVHNLWGTCG